MLVALPLLAAFVSRRPAPVAAVVAAQHLPWLLVGLPVGAVVDRLNRFSAMVRADLLRAGVLAGLLAAVATGHVTMPVLYAAAFAVGCADTVGDSAAQAATPEVLDPARLDRGNSLLLAAESGSEQFVGPAVGGLVFAASMTAPFLADAVSFLGSAALVAWARRRLTIGRRAPAPAADPHDPTAGAAAAARPARTRPASSRSIRRELAEGFRWFRTQPLLKAVAGTVAALAFFQALATATLVLFGLRVLHLSGAGYGVFLGATAIGNVVGSLVAARTKAVLGTGGVLLSAGLLSAGTYAIVGASRSPVAAGAALTLEALAVGCANVATLSLRQSVIPGPLMGRVGMIFALTVRTALPAGAIAGGLVAATWGLRAPFVSAAAGQAVAVVAGSLAIGHALRRERAATAPTPRAAAPVAPLALGELAEAAAL